MASLDFSPENSLLWSSVLFQQLLRGMSKNVSRKLFRVVLKKVKVAECGLTDGMSFLDRDLTTNVFGICFEVLHTY